MNGGEEGGFDQERGFVIRSMGGSEYTYTTVVARRPLSSLVGLARQPLEPALDPERLVRAVVKVLLVAAAVSVPVWVASDSCMRTPTPPQSRCSPDIDSSPKQEEEDRGGEEGERPVVRLVENHARQRHPAPGRSGQASAVLPLLPLPLGVVVG